MRAPFLEQIDLFRAGQHGYHTYRIPALVLSAKGTILAFCEARKHSANDDGDIDLVLRRSFDNGRTWSDMQLVWDNGQHTVGNPCPLLDRDTGTVWLAFCVDNDRVCVTHSRDDGASWAPPRDITEMVKPSDWTWYATGPGHGIQLATGRLLVPCDHRAQGPTMYSHVFFSDDHGGTWRLGGVLDEHTDECEAVQTEDGSVYLNMRSYHGRNRRAVAWSRDGGETWSEAVLDETLIEPVCQAGLVRFTTAREHDKNRVLFSNPASTRRERLTVRVSYDECRTWTAGKVLEPADAAYSDLCVAPDMTICCLYERGHEGYPYDRLTLGRFNLEWLTDGADGVGE